MMEVYTSGWLVMLFVVFCIAVIIGQLIPAVLILIGTVKALKKGDK